MVLIVAFILVVANSIPSSDGFFRAESFAQCECPHPDFEVEVLSFYTTTTTTTKTTKIKDHYKYLRKVLIGVLGFCSFVLKFDQLEASLSLQRLFFWQGLSS